MGVFKDIRLGRQLNKRGFQTIDDLDKLIEAGGSVKTFTGVPVSETTAVNFSAVYNAVWIISNTLASLPLILYKRTNEFNKERNPKHELYALLHNQPNPEMTSYVWREISQAHLLLWGNAYSQIIRDGMNRVVSIWPLNPSRMQVKRNERGNLYWFYCFMIINFI